jgi:hypothetical protein
VSADRRAAPAWRSAASSARPIAAVRAARARRRARSWSRYDRTTGNAAGHTMRGWLCGLNSAIRTSFAAAISFARAGRGDQLEDVEAARHLDE